MATPQEYRGSSDRHYRRGKDLKWQDVERLLSVLGRSRREAIRGYCPLMLEELKEPYEKVESWGQAAKATRPSRSGFFAAQGSRGSSGRD